MRLLMMGLGLVALVACSPAGGGRGGSDGDDDKGGTGFDPNTTGDDTVVDTGGGGDGCQPGQKSCEGNASIQCQLDGTWGPPTPCAAGTVCNSFGACQPCAPGQQFCQGSNKMVCDATGTGAELVESCPSQCYSAGVEAVCVECQPGAKECRSAGPETSETWECVVNEDLTTSWTKTATCPDGADCVNGLCVNPCQSDVKLNTNQGCDYYAVDLENTMNTGSNPDGLTAANAQFAVIISNPGSKEIKVDVLEKQKDQTPLKTVLVPGNGLEIIELGPRNVSGTQKDFLAYRIKGSAPFVAYQFNPLDNVNQVFSNDASLLLPVNATGRDYMIMTASGGGAFVTIVGSKNETEVTVTVTADTDAGPGISGMKKGESQTYMLSAGELLNLRATATEAATETLTGTTINANKNVVVFAGNVLANQGGRCCADHLEQQVVPLSAWGTTYVAAKSKPRMAEADHWRVLASQPDTTVTFSGGVANPKVLQAGEFMDLDSKNDFVIKGDKPILVGQFLASSFEILPDGVYCNTKADCASGVCVGEGSGGGMCVKECKGSSGSCGSHEFCIDNKLLGDDSSGGSCIFRACNGQIPCPGSATCVQGENVSQCLQTCVGFGNCANPVQECAPGTEFGDICVPSPCSGDFECSGGYCSGTDNPLGGQCIRNCAPTNECGAGSNCIPPGYVNDPTVIKGICTQPGCKTDSDCDSGHTCVITDDIPDGSCQPIGDPAFILSVPVEQFRKDYVFLAPNAYKEDYVNIVAPGSAQVTMDGNPIGEDQFTTVPGAEYKVARILVPDGTHRLTATEAVGVVVYGYHDDVSYGYPGGANLFELNN